MNALNAQTNLKKIAFTAVAFFALVSLTGQSCLLDNVNRPADGGVFKSKDGGDSWAQMSQINEKSSLGKANIVAMAIDPTNVDTLYAGSAAGGLYKTINGGKSWASLGVPANRIDRIVINPNDTAILYVSGHGGGSGKIFQSIDEGVTWTDVYTDPVVNQSITALDIDPSSPETLYAGTGSNGIIKSVDSGRNWKLLDWAEARVSDLRVDPSNTRRFYLSTTTSGFYRSENGGDSIDHLEIDEKKFPRANDISDFSIDLNQANTLYATSRFGLLKSTDAGNSWDAITTLISQTALPVRTVTVDPKSSNVLYVSTANTLYKSMDGGFSWVVNELPTSRAIMTLTINPLNTDFLYAGLQYLQ